MVRNNPVNLVDPFGLANCTDQEGNTYDCPDPDVTSTTVYSGSDIDQTAVDSAIVGELSSFQWCGICGGWPGPYWALLNSLLAPAPQKPQSPAPTSQAQTSSCTVGGKVTGTAQGAGQATGSGALGYPPPVGSVAIDPAALGLTAGTASTNALLRQYASQITFTFDPAPRLPSGFPTTFRVGDVVGPASSRLGPLIFDIQGFTTIRDANAATVQSDIVTITYPSSAPFVCAPIGDANPSPTGPS